MFVGGHNIAVFIDNGINDLGAYVQKTVFMYTSNLFEDAEIVGIRNAPAGRKFRILNVYYQWIYSFEDQNGGLNSKGDSWVYRDIHKILKNLFRIQ